jgi:hypothetical protein
MDIVIIGKVDKNHRLTAELPESVPTGEVEVVIRVPQTPNPEPPKSRAAELKAAFEAAGFAQFHPTTEQAAEIAAMGMMSEAELDNFVASLPDDMPTSEEMIRDVRGNA